MYILMVSNLYKEAVDETSDESLNCTIAHDNSNYKTDQDMA